MDYKSETRVSKRFLLIGPEEVLDRNPSEPLPMFHHFLKSLLNNSIEKNTHNLRSKDGRNSERNTVTREIRR